jgi:hypothetical protein
MPFISKEHRAKPDLTVPGDRCYLEYKKMLGMWRTSSKWTTVDQILEEFIVDEAERAFFLAFLVFFALHVMPYEIKKREENGEC